MRCKGVEGGVVMRCKDILWCDIGCSVTIGVIDDGVETLVHPLPQYHCGCGSMCVGGGEVGKGFYAWCCVC